jgi:hypothetical protein
MKTAPLLHFVLGVWLGGSLILGAVVAYNFSGIEDLFARNPKLEAQAGFAADDAAAKKTSLLWVNSTELNRVFFEAWNRTQLVLGGLAVLLAVGARARRLPVVLLTVATVLVAVTHWGLEPKIVELGRALDFTPRVPPPPVLDEFQRYHGAYFLAETLRLGLVGIAALVVLTRAVRSADRGGGSGPEGWGRAGE